MASKSSALGALSYEVETNFGEITTTTATRLRPIGAITCDVQHTGMKVDILRQRPNEGVAYVRGPMGGSISFTLNITGLGASTATTAPASAFATFGGTVFGSTSASHSSALTISGGTAAAPTAVSASTITPGSLIRVGAKGDLRNDGQWVAVGASATTNINPLTALAGVPNSGDIIYCSRMVNGSQTPGTFETLSSVRFLVQYSQQQYLAHGCYPTASEWVIDVGGIPSLKLTYAVAWWETRSSTFPSATAVQDYGAAPVAGGSMFLAAVGTSTRTTVVARSVSMTVGLANMGENGVGGFNEFQQVVGCNRGPATLGLEMVIDSETAGTDTYGALFAVSENSRTNFHALYSMSIGDGRSAAMYWPNLAAVEMPIQFDDGGVLRKRLRFEPQCGTVTTSDLTMSPWRLGMA
jgi:hypothetical protein